MVCLHIADFNLVDSCFGEKITKQKLPATQVINRRSRIRPSASVKFIASASTEIRIAQRPTERPLLHGAFDLMPVSLPQQCSKWTKTYD
jgi:hypothetical protein